MNQHVAPDERIDPETGEITTVSPTTIIAADQVEAPSADPAVVEAVAVPDAEKRKLPRQPVLDEKVPPLPTPDADRIDPNWDIAQVATKGHVHLERIFMLSEKLFWPTILLAVLSAFLIFNGMPFSGPSFSLMGNGSGAGGMKLVAMVIPFAIIGVAVIALAVKASGTQYDDPALLYGIGGIALGLGMMIFWMSATQDPNGSAAWILFAIKVAVAIGLIVWVGNHLINIGRSGESKAVVWMAGAYVAFVVGGSAILSSVAVAMSGFGPGGMQSIAAMLTYDRDTYFDLGGGLRSGPEYRWMSEYAPKGGLSVAKLNALIGSVRLDSAKHSNDAANWEEVTKLDTQPMITRPEKAIRDNAKELPNGIVVIPADRDPLAVVAHVDGQWSITLVNGQNCAVLLGPFDPAAGCQNATTPTQPLNANARRVLDTLKPIPVAETKE